MATAIITGGSSGLGLEFAKALAAKGYDLVLIARGVEALARAKNDLEGQYKIKVAALNADLADEQAVEKVVNKIRRTRDLAYFINNAGFGVHIDADDHSKRSHDIQRKALDVMALNTLIFSSAAASVMKKSNSGHIINVASTSAWLFNGNYSAIKSYVLTYTQSLALSLKDSSVTATAVCPSWMHTNFHAAIGLGEPAIPEWLYVRPDQVVNQALAGAEKGKAVVIPTWRWRFIIWCLQHGPVALRRYVSQRYQATDNYKK